MRTHLTRKGQLFHPGPAVVVRPRLVDWLVRIGGQELQDGALQFSRVSLQIIKEIDAKPVWMNVSLPSLDDRARVRAQTHPSAEQIPMDVVDIGRVKGFNLPVMHFHRQVRPESLHWITCKEDHF